MSSLFTTVTNKLNGQNYPLDSITLDEVTSFKEKQYMGFKQFNFVYGLNGSGKTTISRLLANPNRAGYENCEIKFNYPNKPPEILVYNEDYVVSTFHTEDKQKGIFTLDASNKKAIEEIELANKRKEKLTQEREPLSTNLIKLQNEHENSEQTLTDELYDYQRKYKSTGLSGCVKGFMSPATKFKDKILSTPAHSLEAEKIETQLKEFEKEYSELSDKDTKPKTILPLIEKDLSNIEHHEIFELVITGSSDSYLSELIEQLDHENWIKEGITKYIDQTDICPFCTQEMTQDLKVKIKSHINESYNNKLKELKDFEILYSEHFEQIIATIDEVTNSGYYDNETEFITACENLKLSLKSNLNIIKKKIASPNTVQTLEKTFDKIISIDDLIKSKNKAHIAFNKKLDSSEVAKIEIQNEFWKLLRKLADDKISTFQKFSNHNQNEQKLLNNQISKIDDSLKNEDVIINGWQAETKNVDEAVEWINRTLTSLGLSGFYIEKEISQNVPFYRLTRSDNNKSVFHSLSEGEKTLISFLYFIQSCIGVNDEKTTVEIKNRVIVIDDPISSLSFNHVFDVACLIRRTFFSDHKYGQVILLTHHLYFLHEMFSQIERGDKLIQKTFKKSPIFRVIKDSKSQIENIDRSDIQNNYESYWQIIKDVKYGKASPVIMPNAMRNILEHYFSFIHCQDKLGKAFADLSEKTDDIVFSIFERYVNKESHSDTINHTDLKEVDVEKFISYFEGVFKETDFHEHYKKMMGLESNDNVQAGDNKKQA